MAYLHCHSCRWQQDDFWDKSYNPLRSLVNWEEMLLADDSLDATFTDDASFIEEHGKLTRREVIAREIEAAARTVRQMVWRDRAEHDRQPCPKCGAALDID